MFEHELTELLNLMHPLQFRNGGTRKKTIKMLRAIEVFEVIRHELWKDRCGDKDDWCVDARKPMQMTDEPLPKMERMRG